MTERICSTCGRAFERYPISASRASKPQYCSHPCRVEAVKARWADGSHARFWRKVGIRGPEECWEWTGHRRQSGYGWVSFSGKTMAAHRAAYLIARGSIAAGAVIRHRCDNPPCCNPKHLLSGTQRDNVSDMMARARNKPNSMPGEAHPAAKLTREKVLEIRRSLLSNKVLARVFGVTPQAIRNVRVGRSWACEGGGNV